jgi:DNA-binding LacI/PurR family transcriptional regulator
MARELGSNSRLPSTRDLQEQLDVSAETLNLALREMHRRRLIYSKRGVGLFVAPQKILLLCDPMFFPAEGTSPFWKLLIEAIHGFAEQEHEQIEFVFLNPPGYFDGIIPSVIRNMITAHEVRGVLGLGIKEPTSNWIEAHGVPVVVFAGMASWTIMLTTGRILDLGVSELVRRGCRDIALWRPHVLRPDEKEAPATTFDADVDLNEWKRLLSVNGLAFDTALTQARDFVLSSPDKIDGISYRERGYRLAMNVFGSGQWPLPDGIVCVDDVMSQGVLEAFDEMGIRVGEDVLMATHANSGSPLLKKHEDSLILIEFDTQKIAKEMFQTLRLVLDEENAQHLVVTILPIVKLGSDLVRKNLHKTLR